VQAKDAILIDTTMLTQEEQVSRIVALVDAARGRDLDGGRAGPG
jgi:cytidylate kinase